MTGALRRTLLCARMLARYFSRRVLSVGPLRSTAARAVLVLVALAFVAGASVVAYGFMHPVGSDLAVWQYVFDLTSVSVTMMVLGIFMGLKLLLGGGLIEFTSQLPVDHRERRGAVLAFEFGALAVVVGVMLAAMSIAATLILGPRGVLWATTPLATALVVYLALAIAHNLGDTLLAAIGLRRVRSTVLLLLTFGALLWLNARLTTLIGAVSLPGPGGDRALIGLNLLPWLLGRWGGAAYAVGTLLLISLLALVALLTAPNSHPGPHRFVNLPLPAAVRGPFAVHLGYALRNQHLWLGASLAVALFAFLAGSGPVHPLWAASLLSLPGMYHYGNTRALRVLHPERGAWGIWARMAAAQALVVVGFLAVGQAVLLLVSPGVPAADAVTPALGALAAVAFAVLVGCAFPAENDNPFSALMGTIVLAVILAFVGIVTGLLQLPAGATAPLLASLVALSVAVSVWSIHTHESRSRHEVRQALAH